MSVTTMSGQDVIVRTQRGRHTDGDRLLTHRRVEKTRDAAVLKQRTRALLEEADTQHRGVHR
jgi:hypothetical protein